MRDANLESAKMKRPNDVMSKNQLTNLPWNDVIFNYIFPHLSLRDLIQLRSVSQEYRSLVDNYFNQTRVIKYGVTNEETTGVAYLKIWAEERGHLIIPKDGVTFGRKSFEIITRSLCNLQELHLRNCKWINDDLLKEIFNHCKHSLTFLDISNCLWVTNECLINEIFSKRCSIQVLLLKQCHWISEETISAIASTCSNLKIIDLSSCWILTDFSIIKLIANCPKLASVNLSNVYSITDASLDAMSARLHMLSYLNISECYRITDQGLSAISLKMLSGVTKSFKSDRSLRFLAPNNSNIRVPYLDIRRCSNISSDLIQSLKSNEKLITIHSLGDIINENNC